MILPVVLQVKCHYCSRFRHPKEVIRMTGGPIMCWRCWEGHQHALRLFQGQPPPGCQMCGVTFKALSDATPGTQVRMFVHWKDGIYQILCKTCSDKYIPKRVDLYGATEFGKSLKLTG